MSAATGDVRPEGREALPQDTLPLEGEDTLSLPEIDLANEPRPEPRSRRTSHRDEVVIPDYTLLKRIGAGAYGEVWLAQSVTGALRAVKIVWREDFELTKTFHREFIGIQQFEPISRGHPGLVHILHVGWNEKRGFYYCVMELADDAERGPHIEDLAAYVPRTLGTDMRRHGRLDLHFCKEAGIFLADALHYMHQHGLTHRDIKPSNIIFVGGVCKLADIGLVAGFGERTFAGTEGFVPPEGPGTAQADIYSLGKVLYEMSSGKDRMEFPEIPTDLADEEWAVWMDLNRVICKSCAPDLKERFHTGEQFAEALRKVGEQKPETFLQRVGRLARAAVITLLSSAFAGGALAAYKQQKDYAWARTIPVPVKPVFKPATPQVPQSGKPWQSRYGQWFTFVKDRHVADAPVEWDFFFRRFLEATYRPFEGGSIPYKIAGNKTINAAVVPPADATAFCEWMTQSERKSGHLAEDQEYQWKPVKTDPPAGGMPLPEGATAFACEIVRVPYGRVTIDSSPRGADVYEDGALRGKTPLHLPRVRTGEFAFNVSIPGYKDEVAKGKLEQGQSVSFNLRLKASGAVVFGKPWQNSLGMKFVSLGQAMIATHETTRKDFAEYASAKNLPLVEGRELEKEGTLPVTLVTRAEAQAFCEWLTEHERGKGLLEPGQLYRLPSDDEWSMAAYLPREKGASPSERNMRITNIYPWGFTWPPMPKPGNLFDKSADPKGQGITGYDDGKVALAAIGSFRPDSRGLYDLAGNVWEWISEPWGGDDPATKDQGVVRGGSYTTMKREELLASFRFKLPADTRLPDVGFRCVLVEDGKPARVDE
jgi:serine/threonine protein kinase/formylglycine-generating enzyme required for sulfatase activity